MGIDNKGGLSPKQVIDKKDFRPLFDEVYKRIEEAGNGADYSRAVMDLGSLMGEELRENNRNGFGDLAFSRIEWADQVRKQRTTDNYDKLDKGESVRFRTDTLQNQRRPTDHEGVSQSMADSVTEYVNGRGRGYITAFVDKGVSENSWQRCSPWQTVTTIKGYSKTEVPKEIGTFDVDWERTKIKGFE